MFLHSRSHDRHLEQHTMNHNRNNHKKWYYQHHYYNNSNMAVKQDVIFSTTWDIKVGCFMIIIIGYILINIYLVNHIEEFSFLRQKRYHYYYNNNNNNPEQQQEQRQERQQYGDHGGNEKHDNSADSNDMIRYRMEQHHSDFLLALQKRKELNQRRRNVEHYMLEQYERLNFTTNESLRYRLDQQMIQQRNMSDLRQFYAQYVQSLRIPVTYISSSVATKKTEEEDQDNRHINNDDKSLLVPYDVYDCPNIKPFNYPYTWRAIQVILRNWNPDNITIPNVVYHSLCIFNWKNVTQRRIAMTYQYRYEVPFILQNYNEIIATSYRWNQPNYMDQLLQNIAAQKNEHSYSNHFMYYRERKNKKRQQRFSEQRVPLSSLEKGENAVVSPPTDNVNMTFAQWKEKAIQYEEYDHNHKNESNKELWYFRLNGIYPTKRNACSDLQYRSSCNIFLYDELPFFSPLYRIPEQVTNGVGDNDDVDSKDVKDEQYSDYNPIRNLFMVNPEQERGLNCRFGMKGIIAEAHFDPTRNWIIMFKGMRRYILAHPNQCQNLELYPMNHPSGRHSSIDWSNMTQLDSILQKMKPTKDNDDHNSRQGSFYYAQVTEVVLQPGDALYLPTSWFHYIVSLTNMNYQCNARSGVTTENNDIIRNCGFPIP